MSLTELIAGVEAHETTLTVYNAEEAVADLRERFADRNLTVEVGTATGGPDRFAVLSRGGECVSAIGIEALLADPDAERAGFGSDPYRPILDHLDETLFTSYDRGEMLSASREIEDRAWRVGRGELHAGFQRLSTLRPQLETYRALGQHDGLTVHTYGIPDAEIRTQGAFLVHAEEREEIATSWFVAFDATGVRVRCSRRNAYRASSTAFGPTTPTRSGTSSITSLRRISRPTSAMGTRNPSRRSV
ncbi:MAG: histidine kinase [Halalkalicoccus sp.]|nr:histidine kinase [Halalkalicoccus sp.]